MFKFNFLLKTLVLTGLFSGYVLTDYPNFYSDSEYVAACNVLGISEKASLPEIKKGYREKAKILHPDVTGGDKGKFAKINNAHEYLIKYFGYAKNSQHAKDRAYGYSSGTYLKNTAGQSMSSSTTNGLGKLKRFRFSKPLLGGAVCYGLYSYMKPAPKLDEKTEKSQNVVPEVKEIIVQPFDILASKKNDNSLFSQQGLFGGIQNFIVDNRYAVATGSLATVAGISYFLYKKYQEEQSDDNKKDTIE